MLKKHRIEVQFNVPKYPNEWSDRPKLDVFAAGQYLFASGDFVQFASVYPNCLIALGQLCSLKVAECTIFVRAMDESVATRFVEQYNSSASTRVISLPKKDEPLLLLGQLVAVDAAGRAGLYTCYEPGFVFLNSVEAASIRGALLKERATFVEDSL